MNPNKPAKPLIENLRQQKELYREIIVESDLASQKMSADESADDVLESINDKMNLVRELDEVVKQIAESKTVYSDQERTTLRSLKEELAELISTLLGQTKQLEDQVRAARDGLTPQISQNVMASKMTNAYSTSR